MPGPAAATAPAHGPDARTPSWAWVLLALTLVGAMALRSPGLGPGLDRTEHAFAMADTDGVATEHELAVPGGRLVTLLLPGLFAHLAEGDPVLPGGNLAARGLLGAWRPWHALYAGWLPLLLALLALCDLRAPGGARAALAWGFRLVFLVGLVKVGLAPEALASPFDTVLLLGLAGLSACGLVALLDRPARVTPAMALASGALVLVTAQVVWALTSGADSDESVLRPWLALVDAPSRAHLAARPLLAAANAEHLRGLLDQAALTGFVSLCALLWFLKRRDGLAGAALLAVTLADFGWHHLTLA